MQQRSEETRSHILEAATHLFSQYGYDATGVAEICEVAGVSKGAFYHHFPSKQAVFFELLNSYMSSIEKGFNAMRQEFHNVPQAILQMAEMVGALFQATDIHLPIFLEFWTQANHDQKVWALTVAPFQRFQSYFAEMIQEGINEGSLTPVDPDLAARVLVSLSVGLLMESLLNPQITNWQVEARQSLELFLNGVARRQE
jgi:AcrR family transcriptional regulator